MGTLFTPTRRPAAAVPDPFEAPDAATLRRMDRKRSKRMSNQAWMNPHDSEAEIARLKDGRIPLSSPRDFPLETRWFRNGRCA